MLFKLKTTLTSISMSLEVACDVKSFQTTFTTGNITLERIFGNRKKNYCSSGAFQVAPATY